METKNIGKNKSVCNERGIFMKQVITALGIGILILFLFIYSGLIGEVSFTLLLIVHIGCCMFIFYEPRIIKGSATASGIAVELSERFEQIEKQTKAITAKESEHLSTEPKQAEASVVFGVSPKAHCGDIDTKTVIETINKSEYTFRSAEGIAADLDISRDIAKEKLNLLIIDGLAESFNIEGDTLYALTVDGRRSLAESINNTE